MADIGNWEDAGHDSVWGWLVAVPVCMDGETAVGTRWSMEDNEFFRNGGVNLQEVVAYRVDRVENVPAELKEISDIINPGEFLDG